MNYPYPILLQQKRDIASHPPVVYDAWPTFTYAQCPVCGQRCEQKLNTYDLCRLRFKHILGITVKVANDLTDVPCLHFLGTHVFYNLHNQIPKACEYVEIWSGEVPYITPWFCPDDIESYVVIHALPIYERQGESYVPRYTAFLLTYFTLNPGFLFDRHYQQQREWGKNDDRFYPATVYTPPGPIQLYGYNDTRPIYQLSYWAERGKLGWLDLASDFALVIGKGSKLPELYTDIKGSKQPFKWDRGRREPPSFKSFLTRLVKNK